MHSCKLSIIGSTKACLASEDIKSLEVLEKGYSQCLLFGLLHFEPAVWKVEPRRELRQQIGEKSGGLRRPLHRVSVHEDVLLATVPMEVADEFDRVVPGEGPNQSLAVVDHGV